MSTNLDRFKSDLSKLTDLGREMNLDLLYRNQHLLQPEERTFDQYQQGLAEKIKFSFESNYQRWYTEAYAVLKQLIPNRLAEFVQLYLGDAKRKTIDIMTYRIHDWLNGVRCGADSTGAKQSNEFSVIARQFHTQLKILAAAEGRFESSLFDITQLVRADFLDSELDVARELAKSGFLRGAGALAGLVAAKHLAQVCSNHNVVTRKGHPTIYDFSDLLKTAGVLDVPTRRQIQRLGDLDNLCSQNKKREPTKAEATELIDGTDKLCKTLY
ncbi:MAG TPA: hypothetical protein VMR33_18640 [Candidatus Baltobacteraceae bacterium]|jgi:hypothetical protein|nr:hypothetical protein [Candidatus Baltobacteraceae bacterium]